MEAEFYCNCHRSISSGLVFHCLANKWTDHQILSPESYSHAERWFFHNTIHPLKCYRNIHDLHRFSIENSSILAHSHLFWRFHTFFSHLFQFFSHHIIRLLNCYKNIYRLHRFSIENSSKLAISHLFWRFHTFFSHIFQNLFLSYNPPT